MKTVVFCGSISLVPEMESWAVVLRAKGAKVYTPERTEGVGDWNTLSNEEKRQQWQGFIDDHNQAIRDHDVVFVFNAEKRIGANTTREIGYAQALGKPLYAMYPDHELGIDVLFRGYCTQPEELLAVL